METDGLKVNQQHWHWRLILDYCNFSSDTIVEIQLKDGTDSLPVLVLASLSSQMMKEYLQYVDNSTILEPLVVIPHLSSNDFQLFKKYLFASDVSQVVRIEEIGVLDKVLRILKGESEKKDDFRDAEPKVTKTSKKTVPKIISHSRYGRQRKVVPFEDHVEDIICSESEKEDQSESDNLQACRYCSKVYHHVKARNKHMITDHLDQCTRDGIIFPCASCSAVFVSELGREKHCRTIHKNKPTTRPELFKCPFDHLSPQKTTASFKKLKDLHVHVKYVHPEKDKSCLGCAKDFPSFKDLDEHIQSHQKGTPYCQPFYHCDHCCRVFQKEYTLVVHKRNEHSTLKETLHCQFCQKDFKNAKFLKNHEEKHRKEQLATEPRDDHLCPSCGKSFSTRLNLERHIKSKHQRVKDHQCPDCGKSFVDSTRLKEHRWIHTNHKPYPCAQCDKSFRHKSHLKHHQAKDHGTSKPFECDICHKSFCYRYELVNHSASHQQSSKKRNKVVLDMRHCQENTDLDQQLTQVVFACELCHHHFSSMDKLKEHTIAMHQDENSLVYVNIENNDDHEMVLDPSNFTIEFEQVDE